VCDRETKPFQGREGLASIWIFLPCAFVMLKGYFSPLYESDGVVLIDPVQVKGKKGWFFNI
jgi:hypothetical protein